MIQVCDPPRVRPVRRFSAEEFCFLLRGEAGSLYRPRSAACVMPPGLRPELCCSNR